MAKPIHILILEDNPADAELVQFELREANLVFTAKVVMTEENYIRELQESCPDLILSDYDLPTYNGALALAEAKRRCPDTPFILVTGAVSEDRAIEILTQGAKDYVLKTRLDQRLIPAVKRVLVEAEDHRARKKAEAELREAHRTLEERVKLRTAELEAEIASRKKIEEAQQESERIKSELLAKLNEAQNMAMIGSWEWDLRTNQVWWSDETYRIFGVTPQNYIPSFESNGEFIHPDDFIQYGKVFEHSLQTGEPLSVLFKLILRDGQLKYCDAKARLIYDDADQPLRFVGTLMDVTDRKLAEKALRESEQSERERAKELATILDAVPIPVIIVHDAESTHMTGNIAADELLKQPRGTETSLSAPADVKPRHFRAIKDGRELGLDELPAQRAARGEQVRDFEFSLVFGDGIIRHVLGYGTPLLDNEQKPRGAVHCLVEITKRKQIEEMMRQSGERFRGYFEQGLIGMAISTIDKGMTEVNDALCEMLGYERSDLLRMTSADLTHEDDLTADITQFNKVLAGEIHGYSIDKRFIRKDGDIINTIISVKCIRKIDGSPDHFLALIQDITERKQAERNLMNSEEKFRVLAECSPYAIMMHQGNCWIYANPAAEEISGYTKEELYHMPFWNFVHPDDRETVKTRGLDRQRKMVLPVTYEFKIITRSQEVRWVSLTANTIQYEDKPTILISGIDITERKHADEELKKKAVQLEEANKELESFSYSVSHDLRTPLRAIDGFSRKLDREYRDKVDQNFARTVDLIRNSANTMGALIDDLLSFSKAQKTGINTTKIDMDQLVSEVWNDIRAGNRRRELEFNKIKILPGQGDRSLIRQVLFNLLSNAVKFTKDRNPGVIEISSYEEGDKIVYCVKDNGAGFDMEYYDKLFGVFQRLHSHEEYEGTGIGLAIVQRIVKRHGGSIWAEGKVDEGATFYFSLPLTF